MSSNRRSKGRADLANSTAEPLSLNQAGLGLFCLSAASLAFEVTLTHLFSIAFQYHFAFLAVSLSILGLGVGAAIGYRMPTIGRAQLTSWIAQAAAVFAISMPLIVILFSVMGFLPGYILQAILGALPFVIVGQLTSRLYAVFHQDANKLYAFDLGGAALGLIAILGLLNIMSAASAGFALGITASFAAWIFGWRDKPHHTIPAAAFGLCLIGLIFNMTFHLVDLPRASFNSIPPDKTMFQILVAPGGRIVDSAWSNFARVDLVSGSNPDELYAFTNAGAGSYMYRFDGDLNKVVWLTQQLEYLPFINFSPKKTLILGAGAGKDVLQALLSGSEQITAVEINPGMVDITRRHADFNGDIFDYPGVQTVVADGREYVARSTELYDMIYLNIVYAQAPAPGSSALSESYIFTTEAFRSYWNHLSPNGRLAIVAHQGLEGTRALISAIHALNQEDISAGTALQHAALLRYDSDDPNQSTSVVILQKSPLTEEQIALLFQAGRAFGMQPLFLPGAYEALFAGLTTDEITLDQFLIQDEYNIFPTTDDSPFFFNLDPGLPQPLKILLVLTGGVLLIYLLLMRGARHRPSFWQLLFFAGLGLGYILIEVPLIQRTLLLVGNPTLAMVLVLAALLLSSGVGSLVSARWNMETLWRPIALSALLVAGLSFVFAYGQPALLAPLSRLSVPFRILISSLLLIPLGFVMGIPFANGLRLVGKRNELALPDLWGWNAVTSVMGSALAASLAIWLSFGAAMFAGTACYLIVALTAFIQLKRG
jgi:MFS family permease